MFSNVYIKIHRYICKAHVIYSHIVYYMYADIYCIRVYRTVETFLGIRICTYIWGIGLSYFLWFTFQGLHAVCYVIQFQVNILGI